MITDELARNRDEWLARGDRLREMARDCRRIAVWDSPAGQALEDRIGECAEAVDTLAGRADALSQAYDLHLQVVSVGGRIQI